jgi:hypothetical protein
VKVLLDRKAILNEILTIEEKIKTISRDPTYMKINKNLNRLQKKRYGYEARSMVSVASPDNLEKILNIKYKSQEMKETILRYRKRQNEFNIQIDNLYNKKVKLQEQLFKNII